MNGQDGADIEALTSFSECCAQWLRSTGAKEMVVEIDALGRRSTRVSRVLRKAGLLRRVQWVEGASPSGLSPGHWTCAGSWRPPGAVPGPPPSCP